MPTLFASQAVKAENKKLQETVTDLSAKLDEAKTLSQEVTSLQASIESIKTEFATEVNSLKQQLESLTKAKAEVETQAKAEIEKAREVKKEEVMEQVAQKIAAIGVPEANLPKLSVLPTPAEALERFESLDGAERSEYYKEHKALILQAPRS